MLDVLWIIICPMEIKFLFPYGNEILISIPLKGYKLEWYDMIWFDMILENLPRTNKKTNKIKLFL